MATAPNFLDGVIANQRTMRPTAEDASPWLTRCIFIPFRDRPLSILQMGALGGLTELKAGYVLPLTRYKRADIDYDEMKRVPIGPDGEYQPAALGVSAMKFTDRSPYAVVEAIFRIFNPHHGTDPNQDNGICEVEVLRGNDDMEMLRAINQFCLPEIYKTAREQIAQLEEAALADEQALFTQVAERLLESTLQSVEWARWHYSNLEADMEDRKTSGKDRLSPLDVAVCEWIERDPPRFRSNLTGQAQPVIVQGQAPGLTPPQTQCQTCGAFVNLINGQPPKICFVCSTSFYSEVEQTEDVGDVIRQIEAEKKQEAGREADDLDKATGGKKGPARR
jgi:hypothetical protein